MCWGLPPRLITCRRWRLRYLVGDGFAVRIPHRSVQGALRRAKGKTSSAERYEVNPSFFVAEREGFVQSVAFRATCLRCAIECAVLLRNLRILIKNHLLKRVCHLLFNQSSKPSVFLHIRLCFGHLSTAATVRIGWT